MIADLKPYDEYRIDGPIWCNRIPSHWETVRNGRLFLERKQTGFAELPVLEVSLRTGVRVRDMDAGSRKQVMSDFSKYKRAKRGDIAYNMMRMWQGAIGIVPTDGLVSPAYVVAKPFTEVSPSYYSALFRTDDYKHQIDAFSRGIVKDRNRLYWDAFKQMPSLRPPSDEQALIVRFLDWASVRLGKAIAAKRKVIGLLEEQKQAIIHRAVTRGLNENIAHKPSGLDWLGDVPEHWEVRRLKTFLKRIDQGVSPQASSYLATGDSWGVLKSGCVNGGFFRETEHKRLDSGFRFDSSLTLAVGDVLISRACGSVKYVGSVGRVKQLNYNLILSDKTFRPVFAHHVSVDFMVRAMNSGYYRLQVEQSLSGADGLANNLPLTDLKTFWLAIPPKSEAELIVKFLDSHLAGIEESIRLETVQIILLREYQTRLISDVVTGKLDVREVARSLPADVSEEAAELAATESADEDFATDDELVEEPV